MWLVFKGDIPDDLEVNHIDGVKSNNRLSNLELLTGSDNIKHAYRTGLAISVKGEEKVNAVFSNKLVQKLRKIFATTNISLGNLAKEIGAHEVTLRDTLSGKSYIYVKSEYTEKCRSLLSTRSPRVDVNKIKKLRAENMTSYSIAEITGYSRNTVMKYWN